MNNVFTVLERRAEELVPNPKQVTDRLAIEWNRRANACVHEQIIATTNPRFQTLQEELMGFRKRAAELSMKFDAARVVSLMRNHPVGNKSLQAAKLEPGIKNGRIVEENIHQLFVVSSQAYAMISHHAGREHINHALRIGAAIDVIAEKDFHCIGDGPARSIFVEAIEEFPQEIGAAMDVADRVNTRVGWRRGGKRRGIGGGIEMHRSRTILEPARRQLKSDVAAFGSNSKQDETNEHNDGNPCGCVREKNQNPQPAVRQAGMLDSDAICMLIDQSRRSRNWRVFSWCAVDERHDHASVMRLRGQRSQAVMTTGPHSYYR
jgi:hypothetical protein